MKMQVKDITVEIIRPFILFPQDSPKYDLVTAFLQLRKEVFIDRMAWNLLDYEGIEFEQYDTYDTTYVVAHKNRRVIGGARLRRTDQRNATYSYMIRDAYLGLLPGLPQEMCFEEPPVDKDAWELTRLAALPEEREVGPAILTAANDYLFGLGARTCLFLGPAAFVRMAERLGWETRRLGPLVGNSDGRFLAFECPVRAPRELTLSPAAQEPQQARLVQVERG